MTSGPLKDIKHKPANGIMKPKPQASLDSFIKKQKSVLAEPENTDQAPSLEQDEESAKSEPSEGSSSDPNLEVPAFTSTSFTTPSTRAALRELQELQPSYVSMPYRVFTDVLEAIEQITGRLEITEIVRELLRKTIECCPKDLSVLLYLLCGRIYPSYEGLEMGIGDASLVQALAGALGCSPKSLDQKGEHKDGDLSVTAQKLKATQRTLGFGAKPRPLACADVLEGFRKIAAQVGGKSMTQKSNIIRSLVIRCGKEGKEVKFLVRGLQCKLRCRLAESTVLTALAHALVLTPPATARKVQDAEQAVREAVPAVAETRDEEELSSAVRRLLDPHSSQITRMDAAEVILKQAYSECPNYDKILENLLQEPLAYLPRNCRLEVGVPVKPMLAKPQISFQEVLKRMAGLYFTMEYKYDGERAQIHKLSNGTIKIFSRNSEDTTCKYPDLVKILPQTIQPSTTSFVVDAEAVAIDQGSGKLLPFQVLSTRKRKAESADSIKVQVVLYAFDILYLNGKPVLQEPLLKRRALLRGAFKVIPGKFEFAESLDHREDGDTLPIEMFLEKAVSGNCEGLMIKTLEQNATYEPTKRSLSWLKLKKDYLASEKGKGPADSLDLVLVGANHGQGKRAGWYGAFLLACYNPESEEFQSVCKAGTGFSEEFLAKIKPALDEFIVPSKPSYYKTELDCDVWFDPKVVWEIKAADLSKSTVHKGALNKVERGKGIALRFPRFIRERDDKRPEDATNADQIAEAYHSQLLVANNPSSSNAQDEDDCDFL